MTETKIQPSHLRRTAFVYVRQSTVNQVEHNRESTARQYALVERAYALGWSPTQVSVIDEDLGVSAASAAQRSGFARLTAEVALGHVGIILGLEASRLARNNADWHRLLDLCALTDTLIGDGDGLYHPSLFNDRLVLGLKGTMSEAELHILRARLDGGIRNKAARGELRRVLPVGFVWGEQDGEVRLHPDEAVTRTLHTIFERFTELGSVRRVWLWFRAEGLSFPLRLHTNTEIRWIPPTYTTIHQVLTNPVYAGAYVYGRSRHERYVDEAGALRKRVRQVPRSQWAVLIPEHHVGYIDWETYEANCARIASNTRPHPHQGTGAVREGNALLQSLVTCGHCGRRLRTHYHGRNAAPGYHCPGKDIVNGRGVYCLNLGGGQIDEAVARALHEALQPAALEAALLAAAQLEAGHDAALEQWRLAVERARYEAPNGPSGAIAPSSLRIASSRVDSNPNGNSACASSNRRSASLPVVRSAAPASSVPPSARPCSRSARTSNGFDVRPPRPHGTRKSCCAPCSKKSSLPCTATRPAPTSHSALARRHPHRARCAAAALAAGPDAHR